MLVFKIILDFVEVDKMVYIWFMDYVFNMVSFVFYYEGKLCIIIRFRDVS